MNIFPLERTKQNQVCWARSAISQDDLRVNKMTLETAQMLCSCLNFLAEDKITKYKSVHVNHPCTKWARETDSNFYSLVEHGFHLAKQFEVRFGKVHKSKAVILSCKAIQSVENLIPTGEITRLPLCMPEEYRTEDVVNSYRAFWVSKPNMRYKRSKPPTWFTKTRKIPYESNFQ